MNTQAIFDILAKGLALIPILISAGESVLPLIARLTQVAQGGANGAVTQEELDALEADLDAQLADFNKPMS